MPTKKHSNPSSAVTKKPDCVLLYERYMTFALADAEDGVFHHGDDTRAYAAFSMSQIDVLLKLIAKHERKVNFIEPDDVLPARCARMKPIEVKKDGKKVKVPVRPEMLSAGERFEILVNIPGTRAHARAAWEAAKGDDPFA